MISNMRNEHTIVDNIYNKEEKDMANIENKKSTSNVEEKNALNVEEEKSLNVEENIIEILGARVHNLKNIDVSIPRESLTVITGLSGSGKSSLAFDTIYAEGQRRYIETFSAYARNFLGGMERPDVDKITGLSPVISIEQKTTNKNPRSTDRNLRFPPPALCSCWSGLFLAYGREDGEIHRGKNHQHDSL